MNDTNDLLKETDEQIVAAIVHYAPDGEPERTNEELIRYLADHLAENLRGMVDLLGVGKCVLHNKSFTLKLEISPSSVVIEDSLRSNPMTKIEDLPAQVAYI